MALTLRITLWDITNQLIPLLRLLMALELRAKYFLRIFCFLPFFCYSMYINILYHMKTKTSKMTRRSTKYTAVSNNIYFDGSSYRVRVTVNGEKYSKNFSSRKQAVAYRNQLLSA